MCVNLTKNLFSDTPRETPTQTHLMMWFVIHIFTSFLHSFRVSIISSTVLKIDNIGKEDRGVYQCIVSNARSSAEASAELNIGGRCLLIRLEVIIIDGFIEKYSTP